MKSIERGITLLIAFVVVRIRLQPIQVPIMVFRSVCTLVAVLLGTVIDAADKSTLLLTETRRMQHVDDYHGTQVEDPYRWLEDDVRNSQEVAKWVEDQNAKASLYLDRLPCRNTIHARLRELWDYEKVGTPFKRAGRYFFYMNDGLQNHSLLYFMDSLDNDPHVLIDPNQWSKDGTASLVGTSFSEDGRYVAFGRAEGGSDWHVWQILDIETGRILGDRLKWIKFNRPAWLPDGSGFYYCRYDQPRQGEEFQQLNRNQKIYFHQVGTEQDQDKLIYQRPDQPNWGFFTQITDDGNFLVITVWRGTDRKYRILYMDLEQPQSLPVEIINQFQHEFSFVDNDKEQFFFLTDADASRRRLISIDIRNPEPDHWQDIIDEKAETLIDVDLVGNRFFAKYLKDARTQVGIHRLDGTFIREVAFPGIGTAAGFGGRREDLETFYAYSSFDRPSMIYRYDVVSGESRLLRSPKVKFSPEDYSVDQIFFKSKDGTNIPMFLFCKKGLKRDGKNPTLLFGYGGFNASITPGFSVSRLAWAEMGGLFAVANLRGGGEYGETWHQAGKILNKQNVFDDFIGAAQWLVDNRYTCPEKLAIQGGSNGGLLVGACMTQRPELFGACLPAVGVMDMLRFHKFTAGRFWVDEYGCSDNPEQFKALLAYSPYHNIRPGTKYPATLVTTADTDDRVVPAHSFKFAAALQHAQAGDAPILIRIETQAGHGAGKPTDKIIDEVADRWAFLVANLGFREDAR